MVQTPALLLMIEKWKKSVDFGENFGALLTDLSKAFDCIPHDLIIAKLHAYGMSISSLTLMHSYLWNRKQRTKINNTYSAWDTTTHGVPQGSILGPLIFNIHLCDLFFALENVEISSFADDTTPYTVGGTLNNVIENLEQISSKLFDWFHANEMKANEGKSHLLLSTELPFQMNIRNSQAYFFF